MSYQRILKDITTVRNGKDYCIAKVLTLVAFLSFIGLSIFDLALGGHFNPAGWSMGAAGLIFGGAAGVRIKDATEPNGEKKE